MSYKPLTYIVCKSSPLINTHTAHVFDHSLILYVTWLWVIQTFIFHLFNNINTVKIKYETWSYCSRFWSSFKTCNQNKQKFLHSVVYVTRLEEGTKILVCKIYLIGLWNFLKLLFGFRIVFVCIRMELLCQLQNGAKVKSEDKLHKA